VRKPSTGSGVPFDGAMSSLGSQPRTGRGVPPASRMREEPGIRWSIANGLLLFVAMVLIAAGAGALVADTVLVVVAGLACAALPRTVAAVTGIVAWAWATGFAENRYGVLTSSVGDLTRLAASAAGAVLVAALSRRLLGAVAAHWSGAQHASSR
jgi:hypothetical protein